MYFHEGGVRVRPAYGYNGHGTLHHFYNSRSTSPKLGLSYHLSESEIVSPSRMVTLVCLGGDGTFDRYAMPFPYGADHRYPFVPGRQHYGGANGLFCDGHVEYKTKRKWIEPSIQGRSLWNKDNEPHDEFWPDRNLKVP